MKFSIIVPVMNQHDLTKACLDVMINALEIRNEVSKKVDIVVLDNGSDEEFTYDFPEWLDSKIVRYESSIGVYPTFWEGLKYAQGELLAFFHSDLVVSEIGWDRRVIDAFKSDNMLGLVGFIGSNEIDWNGGRGLGTASNFQGGQITNGEKVWQGSSAEVHGKRIKDLLPSAVVDGCAMIFRRSVLEKIQQRNDFPPHHFYDRLLSCEVLELGFKVGTLGIECDHISGQTVNQEPKYDEMAKGWCDSHGISRLESDHNWDTVVYKTAEHYWLSEYRDKKNFIPIQV